MVDPRIRILFATGYVDHILFFFLRDLALHADVLVLFEAENEWTRALGDHGVRAVQAVPRSRFDGRFQEQVERLYREWPWDVIQSFHGNAQLANLIQWNTRKLPLVGYRAYIGHLKFRENPISLLERSQSQSRGDRRGERRGERVSRRFQALAAAERARDIAWHQSSVGRRAEDRSP